MQQNTRRRIKMSSTVMRNSVIALILACFAVVAALACAAEEPAAPQAPAAPRAPEPAVVPAPAPAIVPVAPHVPNVPQPAAPARPATLPEAPTAPGVTGSAPSAQPRSAPADTEGAMATAGVHTSRTGARRPTALRRGVQSQTYEVQRKPPIRGVGEGRLTASGGAASAPS